MGVSRDEAQPPPVSLSLGALEQLQRLVRLPDVEMHQPGGRKRDCETALWIVQFQLSDGLRQIDKGVLGPAGRQSVDQRGEIAEIPEPSRALAVFAQALRERLGLPSAPQRC